MLNQPKGELEEVLAELREEHRAVKAPAHLETLLRDEAVRRAETAGNAGRNWIWAWGLSAAFLALVLLGAVEWSIHRSRMANEIQVQTSPAHAPVQHALPENTIANIAAPNLARPKQRNVQTAARLATASNKTGEQTLADFVPLPASEGLPPASALSLVRMRIEQSSLQQYGLEVPAENTSRILLAEFAVGEDGLPRAIRIIP